MWFFLIHRSLEINVSSVDENLMNSMVHEKMFELVWLRLTQQNNRFVRWKFPASWTRNFTQNGRPVEYKSWKNIILANYSKQIQVKWISSLNTRDLCLPLLHRPIPYHRRPPFWLMLWKVPVYLGLSSSQVAWLTGSSPSQATKRVI